jgi:hypothetical protein
MGRRTILLLVIVLPVAVLVISGGLTWGLGNRQEKYFRTELLVSIPLCPESNNRTCDYVGKDLDKCGPHDPWELQISLATSNVLGTKKNQKVILIHNIWNYNFSLEVNDSSKTNIIFQASAQRDAQPNDKSAKESGRFIKEILPDVFFQEDRFWIGCPRPTLITRDLGIEPDCVDRFGALAPPAETRFETIELGDINYEKAGNMTWLIFKDLRVVPRDYVQTPQLFWASCTENKQRRIMQIVGITLTSIGCFWLLFSFGVWAAKQEMSYSE